MLVLLGCALARLTIAQQEQNRLCDTALTISNDFNGSQSEDGKGNGSIHNRSLSAWNWIPKFSPHRIPQVIFEAQCSSEYCILPTGVDKRLNSVPIYQDILVLKQEMERKKCFRAMFEKVIVGCTCVRAKTS
ncbi:interleukin 17a/f2 isoform X1 [Danio rerio]|uniref:Interleukin 17a/f2 isoform X1 n=1 Tax=Danio rerio TaxID=7955 RepID=A0A8M3AIQ6_DANRE|nr:interleukin 17a/f2 isoform X1 [Danio rerio]|eukprot:XP_009291138.1 interleukin 17a/f2 isoform X1 [Danio rerio]